MENNLTLTKCYKRAFPFKLATTSYIYPDHILPNVVLLAPFFDEIELVLFESESEDNLFTEEERSALINLSFHQKVGFNVHLPMDVFLGDVSEKIRTRGISIVKKVIAHTFPLNPSVYTLHFDPGDRNIQGEADLRNWQGHVTRSANEILEDGIEPIRISIETLGYPFEWVEEIVQTFGFSICLDIGHILMHGQDLLLLLEKYLSRTSIIHLHGLKNGRDHLGLDRLSDSVLNIIFPYLQDYKGIVSIEVFSMEDLLRSLTILEERWERM